MIAELDSDRLVWKIGAKILFAVLVVVVGLILMLRRKGRIDAWAQALGLQPVKGGFAGTVHGMPCSVMVRHDPVESNGFKQGGYNVSIWVEAGVPATLPAGLRITARRGPPPREGSPIQFGNPALDSAFYVVAADHDAAKQLLANHGLVSVLLVHARNYPHLIVEDGRVRVRATCFQTSTEDPRQFFETATLAAVRAAEALWLAASGQAVHGHDATSRAAGTRGVRLPGRRKP
ncbi:MAG: hypothetical protein IT463_05715 [Planctomycetes bacterium]|nr:hypothetical protein [Planctomycetota bacterium]